MMRDFCRYSTNVGDVVKDSETLSAPCGGTSPRVGGIAKAVLHDMVESERKLLILQIKQAKIFNYDSSG